MRVTIYPLSCNGCGRTYNNAAELLEAESKFNNVDTMFLRADEVNNCPWCFHEF